mmetsp:Transcript_13363/g.27918  ORF Transcript_13363/g.27918 Transcript_13363/m.27918 type:complete len:217 (-) Transcript_13363:17-667(-)
MLPRLWSSESLQRADCWDSSNNGKRWSWTTVRRSPPHRFWARPFRVELWQSCRTPLMLQLQLSPVVELPVSSMKPPLKMAWRRRPLGRATARALWQPASRRRVKRSTWSFRISRRDMHGRLRQISQFQTQLRSWATRHERFSEMMLKSRSRRISWHCTRCFRSSVGLGSHIQKAGNWTEVLRGDHFEPEQELAVKKYPWHRETSVWPTKSGCSCCD